MYLTWLIRWLRQPAIPDDEQLPGRGLTFGERMFFAKTQRHARHLPGPVIGRGRGFANWLRKQHPRRSDADLALVLRSVLEHAATQRKAGRSFRDFTDDLVVACADLTEAERGEPADVMPRGA